MNLKEIVTLNDNREIYYALLDFTQKLAQKKECNENADRVECTSVHKDSCLSKDKKRDRQFTDLRCRVTNPAVLVGSIGLEPTTSTMSTWRSDQLS